MKGSEKERVVSKEEEEEEEEDDEEEEEEKRYISYSEERERKGCWKKGRRKEREKKERTRAARHVIYVSSTPRYAATALTVETRRRLGLVGSGHLIGWRACAHRLTTSIRGERLLPSACHSFIFLLSSSQPSCPLPMSTEP